MSDPCDLFMHSFFIGRQHNLVTLNPKHTMTSIVIGLIVYFVCWLLTGSRGSYRDVGKTRSRNDDVLFGVVLIHRIGLVA